MLISIVISHTFVCYWLFVALLYFFRYQISVLASNLCFNLQDGCFMARVDFADAPMCALVRGASISSMGMSTWLERN